MRAAIWRTCKEGTRKAVVGCTFQEQDISSTTAVLGARRSGAQARVGTKSGLFIADIKMTSLVLNFQHKTQHNTQQRFVPVDIFLHICASCG